MNINTKSVRKNPEIAESFSKQKGEFLNVNNLSSIKSSDEISPTHSQSEPRPSLSTISTLSHDERLEFSVNQTHEKTLTSLRIIHKRVIRRRKIRNLCRCIHVLIIYFLPVLGFIVGITSALIGYLLNIYSLSVAGALTLIASIGLVIQACFWKRSLPNKFNAKEIDFKREPTESLDSTSKEDLTGGLKEGQQDAENGTALKREGVKLSAAEGICVNSAQMRRLSMALNRATLELSSVRRLGNQSSNSMFNFTRRLALTPALHSGYLNGSHFDSRNDWFTSRSNHGLRPGLEWNYIADGRYY